MTFMVDLFDPAETWLPAISMWQPYASLLFVDEPAYRKIHETRGRRYPAKYAGLRVAFQAGLSIPPEISPELDQLAVDAFGSNWRQTLPRGAYVGTAILAGCHPTETLIEHISHADRVAGIWDAGRYAWKLAAREELVTPIPAKGKQGWWRVRPADLVQTGVAASLRARALPIEGGG